MPVCFIGVVAHGICVSRKNDEAADGYFLAGRSLPYYPIGHSLPASDMSGSSCVGLMGGCCTNAIVIFTYEWSAALVLILFAIFIPPSFLKAKISPFRSSPKIVATCPRAGRSRSSPSSPCCRSTPPGRSILAAS